MAKVLIVGGGPAGLYAAYKLAEHNFDVLLVEKDKEIGYPILCAEGISNRTLQLFFNDNNYDFIRNKFNTLIVRYENYKSKTDIPDMGVIVNRAGFDKYIADIALKNGVNIKLNTMCVNAGYTENGVFIETNNGRFEGDVIVIADGVESRIGAFFNIDTVCNVKDIYSCYEYVIEDSRINDNEILFDFSPQYANGGYLWIFPRGNHIANIGLGINMIKNDKRAKDLLDIFIKEYFDTPERIVEEKSGGVPINFIKKPYSDRAIICGDAGRFADPLTGGGIDNAIRTALHAANTIVKAYKNNDFSERIMKHYYLELKKDNLRSLKLQYELKNILDSMSEKEHREFFIALIELLNNKTIMSNDFYSSLEMDKLTMIKNIMLASKTLMLKPILVKTIIKVLWKY